MVNYPKNLQGAPIATGGKSKKRKCGCFFFVMLTPWVPLCVSLPRPQTAFVGSVALLLRTPTAFWHPPFFCKHDFFLNWVKMLKNVKMVKKNA